MMTRSIGQRTSTLNHHLILMTKIRHCSYTDIFWWSVYVMLLLPLIFMLEDVKHK